MVLHDQFRESTEERHLGLPKAIAIGTMVTLSGAAFSMPAAGATEADASMRAAIISASPSPAAELARTAEAELLNDTVGLDTIDSVIGVVSATGDVTKTKRKNVSSLNPGWTAPVKKFGISATYGQAGGWSSGHHTGLDFTGKQGSAVLAASGGKVVSNEYEGAYGNLIKIRHDGGLETWYAHLGSTTVKKGDTVTTGQQVGTIGMTGRTSGPHLHFEVRKGKDSHKNPAHFIWKSKQFPKNVKRG